MRASWIFAFCVACHGTVERGAPPSLPPPAPAAAVAIAPADAPPAPIDAPASPQTSGATVVAGLAVRPSHLVADASGAYWVQESDDGSAIFHAVAAPNATLQMVAGKRAGHIERLALYSGALYFLLDGDHGIDLFRMPERGGKAARVAADTGGEQVAIDASGIYIGTGGGNVTKVGRKKELGGSVEFSFPSQIAVDADSVYVSNELDDTPEHIHRFAKTGGDAYIVDEAGHMQAWGLAADAVYFGQDDAIWRVAKKGVKWNSPDGNEPKAERVRAGKLLAVTADKLYFVDGGHLGIRAIASGSDTTTPVTIGDDVNDWTVADDTLWLVREDSSTDPAKIELLVYRP